MKKYYPSGRVPFGILSFVCLMMTIAGTILSIIGSKKIEIMLLLFGFGIPIGIIALTVFISASLSYLIIDDDKIVFPITQVPKLKFKRNAIRLSEIKYVKTSFYKGDGIMMLDSYMLTFVLKNGLKFTENFRSGYGKKQEEEIINLLKEKLCFK